MCWVPPNVAGKYSRNVIAWISAATRRRTAWNISSSDAWGKVQIAIGLKSLVISCSSPCFSFGKTKWARFYLEGEACDWIRGSREEIPVLWQVRVLLRRIAVVINRTEGWPSHRNEMVTILWSTFEFMIDTVKHISLEIIWRVFSHNGSCDFVQILETTCFYSLS